LIRAQQAYNAARSAEHLPGQYRLGMEYAKLGMERLDLQKQQLELSRQNQVWQWVSLGLDAVGKIGGLIGTWVDSAGRQKELDMMADFKNEMFQNVQDAVNRGDVTVYIDDQGKLAYKGLGEFDITNGIYESYQKRIEAEMGGMKIGDAGRASKALASAFKNMDNAAYEAASKMVLPKLVEQFQKTLDHGVDQAITQYDTSLMEQTLAEAKRWMNPVDFEDRKQDAERKVELGWIENRFYKEAEANGVAAAKAYLESVNAKPDKRWEITQEQVEGAKASGREIPEKEILESKRQPFHPNFTQEDIQKMVNKAQAASTTAAKTAADKALKIFKEVKDGDPKATWADAGEAARNVARESGNPQVWEEVTKAVNGKLFTELHNEWSGYISEAESEGDYLRLKDRLKNSVDNFKGNEPLYNKLMDGLNSDIAREQRNAKTGDEQSDYLKNRFGHEMANAADMSVEELKAMRKLYLVDRRDEYKDHGPLLLQQVDYMDDIIARKEKAASGGAGGGRQTEADILKEADYTVDRWKRGEISGPEAVADLYKLHMKSEDRLERVLQMIRGKDGEGTKAADAYARWDGFVESRLAKLKDGNGNHTKESLDYEQHAKEVREQICQTRFLSKVKPEAMEAYVKGIIELEEANLLNDVMEGKGQVRAREFSRLGGFEPLNYAKFDDQGKSRPAWINDRYREMFEQFVKQEEQTVKDSLKGTGWEMVGPTFELNDERDNKGTVAFKLRDRAGKEAVVRVGMDGKLEKKDVVPSIGASGKREMKDMGTWSSFSGSLNAGKADSAVITGRKLSGEQNKKIDAAFDAAVRNSRSNSDIPYETFERNLGKDIKKIMGNMGETYEGREYINEKLKEFRERLNNRNGR
jgi:hypothetical protein